MGRRVHARLALLASSIALGAVLSGCDTLYGVRPEARLPVLPDGDCVAAILATTPGIEHVDRSTRAPGEVLTARGWVLPDGPINSFSYFGKTDAQVWANLYVGPGAYALPSFSQSMNSFGGPPPQPNIDAARTLMAHIEQRVGTECGRPEAAVAIVEHCSKGLSCPPLPVASPASVAR